MPIFLKLTWQEQTSLMQTSVTSDFTEPILAEPIWIVLTSVALILGKLTLKTYTSAMQISTEPISAMQTLKPVVEFENKEHLIELLSSKAIEPAEEKFKERQALLQQLFNR